MNTEAVPKRWFWRTAAVAILAAAPAAALAGGAVTPERAQRAIVTVEDPLEQETTLSTRRVTPSTRGVFRTPWNDTYLHAYVHRGTGEVRFEVRQTFNYLGGYRHYEGVNYETAGLPATAKVRLIDGNKDLCQAVEFAMTCLEKVVFEVDEAELRRIADAAGGDRPDAWELKFKATYGQDHRAAVPMAEIKALLGAVESYRLARNLRAPHSELAFNDADAAR
jgi:hypothetical protein